MPDLFQSRWRCLGFVLGNRRSAGILPRTLSGEPRTQAGAASQGACRESLGRSFTAVLDICLSTYHPGVFGRLPAISQLQRTRAGDRRASLSLYADCFCRRSCRKKGVGRARLTEESAADAARSTAPQPHTIRSTALTIRLRMPITHWGSDTTESTRRYIGGHQFECSLTPQLCAGI